jgi:hypothetical protein
VFFASPDCRLYLVSRTDGGGSQCKHKDAAFPSRVTDYAMSRLLVANLIVTSSSIKQGKKDEEEFSTGPLSVLMMSVKNNTQVGRFSTN